MGWDGTGRDEIGRDGMTWIGIGTGPDRTGLERLNGYTGMELETNIT